MANKHNGFWGLSHESLLLRAMAESKGPRRGFVHVHSGKKAVPPKPWGDYFLSTPSSSTQMVRMADRAESVVMLVSPLVASESETEARLKSRPLSRIRDAMGTMVSQLERLDLDSVEVDFHLNADELKAALTGLEIALYRFKSVRQNQPSKLKLQLKQKGKTLSSTAIRPMVARGQAVNLARHLTNLAPNELNPVSYADFVQEFFKGLKHTKVSVWDEKRLKSENMNLHYNVGRGSASPPRLVHVRYRPPGGGVPVALVGKGITFDTGGLDIKPSAGMRLMKKDMGGSAAVLAVAYWAAITQSKTALDVYLALAENSVSAESFRPSDLLQAKNGTWVEIHNTDAEGRLVLADTLTLASSATGKDTPRAVIDVATLTGAIKVALGSSLAGLFANNEKLSQSLQQASQDTGDWVWPMPLFQKYRSQMNSNFADMVNAVDGFGGAVTAALFLEKFIEKGLPWAHFDMYAWKDAPEGCWLESGGSGQCVLGLIQYLGQGR